MVGVYAANGMSDITGPALLAEILDDDRKFRLYVVQKLERGAGWQDSHDEKDNLRFAAGEARMARIESNLGGVSSKVEAEHDGNRYTLRQMVGGLLVLCGAIGGVISFVLMMIGHGGKP